MVLIKVRVDARLSQRRQRKLVAIFLPLKLRNVIKAIVIWNRQGGAV